MVLVLRQDRLELAARFVRLDRDAAILLHIVPRRPTLHADLDLCRAPAASACCRLKSLDLQLASPRAWPGAGLHVVLVPDPKTPLAVMKNRHEQRVRGDGRCRADWRSGLPRSWRSCRVRDPRGRSDRRGSTGRRPRSGRCRCPARRAETGGVRNIGDDVGLDRGNNRLPLPVFVISGRFQLTMARAGSAVPPPHIFGEPGERGVPEHAAIEILFRTGWTQRTRGTCFRPRSRPIRRSRWSRLRRRKPRRHRSGAADQHMVDIEERQRRRPHSATALSACGVRAWFLSPS